MSKAPSEKCAQILKRKTGMLLIILSMSLFEFSCSDNPISNSNGNNTANIVNELIGIVYNLNSNKTLIRGSIYYNGLGFYAGVDTIGSDHHMAMNLSEPDGSRLIPINQYFSSSGQLNITDTNAYLNFLLLSSYDTTTNSVTGVLSRYFQDSSIISVGDFSLIYIYSDRTVEVNGIVSSIEVTDTLNKTFAYKFFKGWNRVTKRYKTIREHFREIEYFTGEPEGASWYYFPN